MWSRVGSAPSRRCSARISKRCRSMRSMRIATRLDSLQGRRRSASSRKAARRRKPSTRRSTPREGARSGRGFRALLSGIIAVDSLNEALAKRPTLLAGESVITRDGIWFGRDWLRVSRDKDVHAGVIGREKEMRELREAVDCGRAAPRRASGSNRRSTRARLRSRRSPRFAAGGGQSAASRAERADRRRSPRCARRSNRTPSAFARSKPRRPRSCADYERAETAVGAARARLQEGTEQMAQFEEQRLDARGRARSTAQQPVREALAGASRPRRRARRRDQGGVEAFGIDLDHGGSRSRCAVSSSN